MIKDINRDDEMWIEGKLYLPWTESDILISIVDGCEEEYAEKCAEFIADIGDDILERIGKYAYRYCNEFLSDTDSDYAREFSDITEENILEHCWPSGVVIENECRRDRIEFHMEWGCDWEEEHGMEVTISDGKILYVGPFENYSPWDEKNLKWAGFFDENSDFNYNYADKE